MTNIDQHQHFPLPQTTVVFDKDSNVNLFEFDGLLPIPVGARINIDNAASPDFREIRIDSDRFPSGRADAEVLSIRVWGTQGSSVLRLDVRLKNVID